MTERYCTICNTFKTDSQVKYFPSIKRYKCLVCIEKQKTLDKKNKNNCLLTK